MIVESSDAVTLIGGGPVSRRDLMLALRRAPRLVAADGGANMLHRWALSPQAVIGDMDSLSPDARAWLPAGRLHEMPEQETTDFDKCLRSIAAPLILAVGFHGARLDHGLAALNALVRHGDRKAVLIGPSDLAFHLGSAVRLSLRAGDRVSLFPLAQVQCDSDGLLWPTQGLNFAPDGRIGTSNAVASGPVALRPSGPGLLVILPRKRLDAVIAALLGQ